MSESKESTFTQRLLPLTGIIKIASITTKEQCEPFRKFGVDASTVVDGCSEMNVWAALKKRDRLTS